MFFCQVPVSRRPSPHLMVSGRHCVSLVLDTVCLSVCLSVSIASVQTFDQTAKEAQEIQAKRYSFEDYVR